MENRALCDKGSLEKVCCSVEPESTAAKVRLQVNPRRKGPFEKRLFQQGPSFLETLWTRDLRDFSSEKSDLLSNDPSSVPETCVALIGLIA